MPENPLVAEIQIKVAGTALSSEVSSQLFRVEVETTVDVPSMAILSFNDDKELTLINGTMFDLGKEIEILAPNFNATSVRSTNLTSLFKGEITALEPHFADQMHATLTVRAYDKRHRMNRGRKSRVFLDVTDSDMMSQIAGEYGLSPTITATSAMHKHVIQPNITDLEFFNMLAKRNSLVVTVENNAIKVEAQKTVVAAILKWGVSLIEFHPRVSVATQVNEVIVRGWDSVQQQEIVGTATNSTVHPSIGIPSWGGAKSQSAISAEKTIEVFRPVMDQSEAQKLAQAILDESNGSFIEADGIAFGSPAIKAGSLIQMEDVGTKFSGKYSVTAATHVYEPQGAGYTTYFRIEGLNRVLLADLISNPAPSGIIGLMPAIVTNNLDTQDNKYVGHVKVKYIWKNGSTNVESWWAPVVSSGAGNQRGFYNMPEINDEVLVGFENGDVNRPYVLGGMWSNKNKTPDTPNQAIDAGKVEHRMLKTRIGHTLLFNDKSGEESITLKDGKDKHVMLFDVANNIIETKSEGDMNTELKGKSTSKATGDFKIETQANFETKATSNATIEATSNLNLKGTGGAKLETPASLNINGATITIQGNGSITIQSSGTLTLKGSAVMIN